MKKVFLSYSRKDAAKARELYKELKGLSGLDVWYDKESLLPGMQWRPAIRKAIRESDFFIALLSKGSVSKKGYRHSELRQAMEIKNEFPEDAIFLIPARLNECEMPFEELGEINYADLYPDWSEGVGKLKKALGVKKAAKKEAKRKRKTDEAKVAGKKSIIDYEFRIGLADLDIGLTNLAQLAEELNLVQSYFHFTLSKLRAPPDAVGNLEDLKNLKIYRLPRSFYRDWAHLNVDQVICLTKYFLAFEEDDEILYNYISGQSEFDERFIFVSVGGLYDYAKQAGLKYETALVFLITSELACYFMDVEYHDALRACPMDFTRLHETIVPGLQKAKFCSCCAKTLSRNGLIYEALTSILKWGRD